MLQGNNTLTIGLPICNEDKNLEDFFRHLYKSLSALDGQIQVETIACINGCTDNSLKIVTKIANSELGKRINLRIIESKKGKVNAISEIVKHRKNSGHICFIDTDTMLPKETIPKLLARMKNAPECYVCYAKCVPYYENNKPLTDFQAAQKAYYEYREKLPPRRYFHGRAYILRDDIELKRMSEENNNIRLKNWHDQDLSEGIRIDDIYLSASIHQKYGEDSIHEVSDAPIFFHPPENEDELFAGITRTLSEITRIRKIFPQLSIENKLDRERKTAFSSRDEREEISVSKIDAKGAVFMDLESQLWKKARDQLDDAKHPHMEELCKTSWITLHTTKKPFNSHIGPQR